MTENIPRHISDVVADYGLKLTNIVYVWSDGMQNITVKTTTKVVEVSMNGDHFYTTGKYFTVKISSVASGRMQSTFTVTTGELEPLITALIMLKDELTNSANDDNKLT